MSHIHLRTKYEKRIYFFIKRNHAVTAAQILKDVSADKATVYRILKKLIDREIIKEIIIDSEKTYYELDSLDHHHHIVCRKCEKIIPIVLTNGIERKLTSLEDKISSELNFYFLNHSLNFFGLCSKCK